MSQLSSNDLKDFDIECIDGKLGKVKDLYFDEKDFYLRYLVVDTEGFLLRNLVLVSPMSFSEIDEKTKTIYLYLDSKELENSPPLGFKETVSQQYEKAYNEYFAWPNYWEGFYEPWDMGPYGVPWEYYQGREVLKEKDREKSEVLRQAEKNTLRSERELRAYQVHSKDGNFGHIQGLLIDKDTLSIEFMIIDTINYFPSKLVLLRPEWMTGISWTNKWVSFPFEKGLIKNAPSYKGNGVDDEYIRNLDEHFWPTLLVEESDISKLKIDGEDRDRGGLLRPRKKKYFEKLINMI